MQQFKPVKIRRWEDTHFIAIADIPEPHRSKFNEWLKGQGVPVICEFHGAAHASDWRRFVEAGKPL